MFFLAHLMFGVDHDDQIMMEEMGMKEKIIAIRAELVQVH